MKIIIFSQEDDNHAAPIKWALGKAGYEVAFWPGLSSEEEQQASLLLDDQGSTTLGLLIVEPGDVIWVRRPLTPEPNPDVSPADRKFAQAEYRAFYNCIAYMLENLPNRVVNKYSASQIIRNKAIQLHLARACGMKVPKTLFSNSPMAIKDFVSPCSSQTVCKAFTPHVWRNQSTGGVAVAKTFELTREQLPADKTLTFAPGIYQDMVRKDYDVRTVIMGHRVYSCALHNPLRALDWRLDAGLKKVQVQPVTTPAEVESGLIAFAKKAGISFGSVDFAVTADGAWWFLEINEQGQFLWLDQMNPEVKILEKFCAFITAPGDSIQVSEESEALFPSLAEYEQTHKRPEIAPPKTDLPGISMEP